MNIGGIIFVRDETEEPRQYMHVSFHHPRKESATRFMSINYDVWMDMGAPDTIIASLSVP